jgi:hypothetical protein
MWAAALEWQRESAIHGVQFHLDNPDASASASHESWLKEKLDQGWRYGSVKNPDTVPFSELPPEQQAKDHLFSGIVRSLVFPMNYRRADLKMLERRRRYERELRDVVHLERHIRPSPNMPQNLLSASMGRDAGRFGVEALDLVVKYKNDEKGENSQGVSLDDIVAASRKAFQVATKARIWRAVSSGNRFDEMLDFFLFEKGE